jgi:hypothetical protein
MLFNILAILNFILIILSFLSLLMLKDLIFKAITRLNFCFQFNYVHNRRSFVKFQFIIIQILLFFYLKFIILLVILVVYRLTFTFQHASNSLILYEIAKIKHFLMSQKIVNLKPFGFLFLLFPFIFLN